MQNLRIIIPAHPDVQEVTEESFFKSDGGGRRGLGEFIDRDSVAPGHATEPSAECLVWEGARCRRPCSLRHGRGQPARACLA